MKRERSTVLGLVVGSCGWIAAAAGQPAFKPMLEQQPANEFTHAPVIACFAEGTDPIYARRVEALVAAMNQARFGADYQLNSRWSGVQGSPRALTWSFVPDGLSISSGAGEPVAPSNLFAQMDAKFAAQGGRATWIAQYVSVFARWQALSGLTYTRITVGGNDWDDGAAWGTGGSAGLRGDLRFSGKNIDGGSNILAYNYFPANGDMVVDTSENWASGAPTYRFFRNTLSHEHGHGMGLNHVCPIANAKLMEPFLSTAFDGPQQDDIRAAQRHYGDPYETNDTSGTAKPMGALPVPGSLVFGNIPTPTVNNAALLSIDANGETDFFSFTVGGTSLLNVTVTPFGSTYLSGAQTSQCNTGTSINTLAIANLSVAVIGTDGVTVLGSSETQAAGVAEILSNVSLPTGGTYFIRVTEANTPAESQLYRISLASSGQAQCPQVSQNPSPQTLCEGNPASFTFLASGNPTPTYQWRRNLVNIPGATNSTYNIANATDANEGSYDCVATNACGSITSAAAALTVYNAPVFTTNPSNQSVPAGSPASFTVVVSGEPTPSVAWRKNGVFITGATNLTYTIPSVTAGDEGTYDCVADNACDQATSSSATLTVTTGGGCYPNCDGSTGSPILTANDFQCFLNAFAEGASYANCDGSTGSPILTANDFQCFLNSFAEGCN